MMNSFLNRVLDNYQAEGISFCDVHRTPLLPCKISGSFLRSVFTQEFVEAWKNVSPNACIDGLDSGKIDWAYYPRYTKEMEQWHTQG